MNSTSKELLASIPSVDLLISKMPDEIESWGRGPVVAALRDCLAQTRSDILDGKTPELSVAHIRQNVVNAVAEHDRESLIPVFNLTGTVIHTNLGRALLAPEAIDAVCRVAGEASTLEFDLDAGARGSREDHVESLICELTGAEAATAVNNNAAAVLLVLNSLALGKNVPVSRGELVEIGGSFRIPEVMSRAGCTLAEVGATNRTHLKDFHNAIDADTALLMKVHTSNFEIQGFTKQVPECELANLAHEHGLPFVVDLGSGNLTDFAALGLPDEPTVSQVLENGADLVTFSGDKLLGGPQAGLIAGKAKLIELIDSNPLKRALRLDKMTLAALAATLKLYRVPEQLTERLPSLRLLVRSKEEISEQAALLLPAAREALGDDFDVGIEETMSQIGSGSLPLETLPTSALKIVARSGGDGELRALVSQLRARAKPIIGRMHKGALWLDLRCLDPAHNHEFLEQLRSIAK